MRLSIGFTGTRHGMNDTQLDILKLYLLPLFKVFDTLDLHHGDCKGADEQMHNLFLSLCKKYEKNYVIHIHEPESNYMQAHCEARHVKRYPKKGYLERDHDIVNECELLIATPRYIEEKEPRSGTWATIRYARKKNKKIEIIIDKKK